MNGIDGVCPEFNCDYTYINTDALITSQTLTNNVDLVIDGVNLPFEDIVVRVNNAYCDIANMVASADQITCTLTANPAAGVWDVEIFDLKGLIPVDPSVDKIEVDLVIDSVSPREFLN